MPIVIRDVDEVSISTSRWQVVFTIHKADGQDEIFVVSADSAMTDHSAIWFGTAEEYREAEERVYGSRVRGR